VKVKKSILSRLGWFIALAVTLLFAMSAFAQNEGPSNAAAGAMVGAILLVELVIGVAVYIYWSLGIVTIAKKTNTPDAVWGWIPILQIVLLLNIAKKPVWWIILMFIPCVSIVISIIVLMAVAEARNKPSWQGILAVFIGPVMLAWVD